MVEARNKMTKYEGKNPVDLQEEGGHLISGVPRDWFMYPEDAMNPEEHKIARIIYTTACTAYGETRF